MGGPNWKIEGKWAENDKNQSIFEGQGGPGPPTSGVPGIINILLMPKVVTRSGAVACALTRTRDLQFTIINPRLAR